MILAVVLLIHLLEEFSQHQTEFIECVPLNLCMTQFQDIFLTFQVESKPTSLIQEQSLSNMNVQTYKFDTGTTFFKDECSPKYLQHQGK